MLRDVEPTFYPIPAARAAKYGFSRRSDDAALKKLGFEQTSESKAVKLLIGTLDVRKLEELAGLDAVIRVKPVVAP